MGNLSLMTSIVPYTRGESDCDEGRLPVVVEG
jgi:hypothetical protein